MSVQLRRRRAEAARALAADGRRSQATWDDLSAWPDWAALDAAALQSLAWHCGAWRHAAALRRCIDGKLLQPLQRRLGDARFGALMALADEAHDDTALPHAPALDHWLTAEGHEVLLASVPSPLLRLHWREQLAPQTLPPLPALDGARARRVLAAALEGVR